MTESQRWWLLIAFIVLGSFIYVLLPILSPFAAGIMLAYLLDPLADRIQEKGLSRTLAVISIFMLFITLAAIALLVLVPLIGSQLERLNDKLPLITEWVNITGLPWLERVFGVSITSFKENVREVLLTAWSYVDEYLDTFLKQLTRSGVAIFALLGNIVLIPVVTFYLLRDWDALMASLRTLLPRSVEPRIVSIAAECDEVLGAFLRGQLLVMFLLGISYTVGLWVINLEFALLVGMLAGLASIIPYLGFFVGFSLAAIIAFFQFGDFFHLFLVLGVFGIGQTLEGTLFTPVLVGDRIGLHPVAVIFAILVGGQLFGFTGMLLALPTAAIVMVLIRGLRQQYLDSGLYLADSADAVEGKT